MILNIKTPGTMTLILILTQMIMSIMKLRTLLRLAISITTKICMMTLNIKTPIIMTLSFMY
jgi:hypothetical protein